MDRYLVVVIDPYVVPNIRVFLAACRLHNFFRDRPHQSLPTDSSQPSGYPEDSHCYTLCLVRVCSDALWSQELRLNLPEVYK